jgi:DNA segregation ATPase FtsK/SpoIIIE, S-DNA-T family
MSCRTRNPTPPYQWRCCRNRPPASRKPVTQDALSSMQAVIRDAARHLFKIDLVPSGEPVVGMTNVRFSFDKAAGQSVSVTKVLDLADDLSVETDRSPVRIYIDSAINFELPLSEEERQFAPIKSLLAVLTPPAADEDDVRYLIGRRQDGRPFELSAHSALHMLVGGATGSGKSVLLHSIIWGLVFRYPPSKVRLALYDHKIEEFATYQNLPHLWQPVVTNEGGYHRLIENLEKEINRRKLARRDDPEARFTWLIVVMDEFRGLSNDALVALIAEARSLQIRFVLGTQRAEKSFISTSIKANLPTGIAFRVRNQLESRLIIGEPDACNLLSHGDCIVHSPSEMERVQTAWVQKSDLKALRGHLSK